MSDFINTLAKDIEGNPLFRSAFAALRTNSMLSEMGFSPGETLQTASRRQLIESASIFADASIHNMRELSQSICASLSEILQGDESLADMIQIVQSKLHNFPAISLFNKSLAAPRRAPAVFQYDFIIERERHSIEPIDKMSAIVTDFQLAVWSSMVSGCSVSISAPTSAGKSFIVLLFILHLFFFKKLDSLVYIVPTRALINQVSDDIRKILIDNDVNDVVVSSSPVILPSAEDKIRILYVLTQERLDVLLNMNSSQEFGLVIIDEAQMISAGSRGVLLESVIDRVLTTRPDTKLIFAGPLIENPEYFSQIFGLENVDARSDVVSVTTQNIIHLECEKAPSRKIRASLEVFGERRPFQTFEASIDLASETDKVSYLASLFSKKGSSLVYSNGKADAEKIAIKMCQAGSRPSLSDNNDLISFVKRHIHPEYALVDTLRYGIAFHYGHMPTLLRKELEDAFRRRTIGVLVCTSTLLHGLNLPAKNIFINKPNTGRSTKINSADFWNLAGRAGRLGKELSGNVYIIDYNSWDNNVLAGQKRVKVRSHLTSGFVEKSSDFLAFLKDKDAASGKTPDLELMAGKLLVDYRLGRLEETIARHRLNQSDPVANEISKTITFMSKAVRVSSETLQKNISISPFRQQDLLNYFVQRIPQIGPEQIMPMSPMGEFKDVNSNLCRVFKRIHTYLLKLPGKDRRQYFYAPLALRWMRGEPLPSIIASAVKYNKERNINKSIAVVIRETMELIEQDLRFRYVNLTNCYNDLLNEALESLNLHDIASRTQNIPLFLELGASSGAMVNFMALGISRITAQVLSEYILNKGSNLEDIKSWLLSRQFERLDISRVCIAEARTVVSGLQ